MSYTAIVSIYPGEKIEIYAELKNSWGSAPFVWDALCARYLGSDYRWSMNPDNQPLWDLWKRQDIPEPYRAVLMMTFDRAYVRKDHYVRAAQDIKKFLAEFEEWAQEEFRQISAHVFMNVAPDTRRVNHWPAIKAVFMDDPDVPGLGLWCTSVTSNPFRGQWNEEKEEYESDWEEIYELYDQLDGLKTVGG